jgi:hypothetical protein
LQVARKELGMDAQQGMGAIYAAAGITVDDLQLFAY